MKPPRYAARTSVPVVKTRMEIETLLARNGCLTVAVAIMPGRAVVGFEKDNRRVRFEMPLAAARPDDAATYKKRVEGEHREQWRALLLALKSKFVSVETGIESFEEAFLAHVVGPSGQTVGAVVLPQLASAYAGGDKPLLLGPGEGSK